ncbi:MAG: hypothetical protein ACE5IR_19740 [bacterium]
MASKLFRKRLILIVVSFAFHAAFFALLWLLLVLGLFMASSPKTAELDTAPLVLNLERPPKPIEVVETPETAETQEKQEQADLASDKNALAMNSETDPSLPVAAPFARGDFDSKELPTPQTPPGEPGQLADQKQAVKESSREAPLEPDASGPYSVTEAEKFSRESLIQRQTVRNPGAQPTLPQVRHDNQESRAPIMGGFSFNTYNWNFAPYMLRLKKKVQGNIFPPPAFYRLGMISGETLLKFKIYPNGELRDLELLEYNGHETLMQTSVKAIEVSVPYERLPADFPERYLEVTAKFSFFIRKQR